MKTNRKVAIVTVTANNYGDFLQAFALKEYINNIDGYNAEILRIFPSSNIVTRCKNLLLGKGIKYVFNKIINRVINRKKISNSRNDVFKKEYERITYGNVYRNNKEFSKSNNIYDIFISGSAFTWSDHASNINAINIYFLKGIIKPKISYAPSIGGGSNFNKHLIKKITPLINEYEHVSVREIAGQEFILNKINNSLSVFHAIDPTLLLLADEWDKIAHSKCTDFQYINKDYIFTYFLGTSSEQRNFVKEYSKSTNIEIITFPHLWLNVEADDDFGDIKINNATPYELLLYIKHAKFIFTDSFHCSVFSGLFKKEFFVFDRVGKKNERSETLYNPRIIDLLSLFCAQNRYIKDTKINISELNNIKTDWNQLDENLSAKREECRKWLKKSLSAVTKCG